MTYSTRELILVFCKAQGFLGTMRDRAAFICLMFYSENKTEKLYKILETFILCKYLEFYEYIDGHFSG